MAYYNEAFIILSGSCAILTYLTFNEKKLSTNNKTVNKVFRNFRINYLTVYYFVTGNFYYLLPVNTFVKNNIFIQLIKFRKL